MHLLLACAPPEENRAPEIVGEAFASGTTVDIEADGVAVYVVAEDPEDDVLTFVWTLSTDGAIEGHGIVARVGSQVDLEQDPGLDGQTLTCAISDGTNDVERSWPLRVVD